MSDAMATMHMQTHAPTGRAPLLPLKVRDLALRFGEATVLDGLDLDLGPTWNELEAQSKSSGEAAG